MKDEIIISIMLKNKDCGLSITELVTLSKLTRSAVRIILARLEGGNKVYMRNVGMAKLYFLNKNEKNI